MNVALIGASGFIGTDILEELLNRGHKVTAIVRNPEKIKSRENLLVKKADVTDTEKLAEILKGQDAVVSAYNPGTDMSVTGAKSYAAAAKKAGVKRLLIVGGAGSLEISPGVQLVDTPQFPAEWKDGARATREVLNFIRTQNDLDWTFFSPAMMIEPGPRTGKFRLGKDNPVFDAKNESRISTADYAVAMVDELEKSQHLKQRFTIGY